MGEVAAIENPPLVHSISYHVQENQIPINTRIQFAIESQKLGLRGVTIVVSTGDNGVANMFCQSQSDCTYASSWPASSPFVVTVGATQGPENNTAESFFYSHALARHQWWWLQ